MLKRIALGFALIAAAAAAQTSAPNQPGFKQRTDIPPAPEGIYRVEPGTHILLSMTNSVSTKQAQPGDRIYLQTAFPVAVNGKIVVPQGSYVTGTITEVKRAGRALRGKAEMQVRFDSLVLPNGVTRDFKADLGALDGRNKESANREQSKVTGEGNGERTAKTVATTTATGAAIGTTAGAIKNQLGRGIGIGTGVGAAAGLAAVMFTRGPDATLPRGSTVEMVLDRPLEFQASELVPAGLHQPAVEQPEPPAEEKPKSGWPGFKRVPSF